MMGKELSEMTLEELWDLFPIFLVQHDDQWKGYYEEIEAVITDLLKDYQIKRISHIGSTAIQGIWAKNIVDVMVEISEKADMEEVAHILEQNGFIRMSDEKRRISLNKGYTKEGFADKVYHIHLRYTGDNDELYFRDYLNEHPHIAEEYEALKSSRRILVFSNMSQPAGSSACFFILCSQGIFHMSVQGVQSPLPFSYSAGLRGRSYTGTAGIDSCA